MKIIYFFEDVSEMSRTFKFVKFDSTSLLKVSKCFFSRIFYLFCFLNVLDNKIIFKQTSSEVLKH